MQHLATVHIWDMLDQVVISAHVRLYLPNGVTEPGRQWSDTIRIKSEGEDDEQEWLKDALIALIETL